MIFASLMSSHITESFSDKNLFISSYTAHPISLIDFLFSCAFTFEGRKIQN